MTPRPTRFAPLVGGPSEGGAATRYRRTDGPVRCRVPQDRTAGRSGDERLQLGANRVGARRDQSGAATRRGRTRQLAQGCGIGAQGPIGPAGYTLSRPITGQTLQVEESDHAYGVALPRFKFMALLVVTPAYHVPTGQSGRA